LQARRRSKVSLGIDPAQEIFQRQQITLAAQAANDANRQIRKIRVLAERLTGMNVGQVHFDEGNAGAGEASRKAMLVCV
jgi:hypothetical protein